MIDHSYEFQNHFTPFDWCKIYSQAISEYDLDMNLSMKH